MALWTALFLAGSAEVLAAVFQANKERRLASSLLAASALPMVVLVLANMFSRAQGGNSVGVRNQDVLEVELWLLGLSALSFWRRQPMIFWLSWAANLCSIGMLIFIALTYSIPLLEQSMHYVLRRSFPSRALK